MGPSPTTRASLGRRAHLGFAAIGLALLAPAMDTSVNIALPSVTAAFGLGARDIQWIVVCYMLTYGSLMLTCGKLGDRLGHRRILLSGLVIATVAFAICATAETYGTLLVGRALQGVGIALTISCLPALATALYPETRRTWVLGVYGAIFAIGTALGPFLGSWLVASLGWSGVFAFRVPLVLVALALALWTLPSAGPAHPAPASASRVQFDWPRFDWPPFDWLGAVLLVGWMTALVLAFSGPHERSPAWPAWTGQLPDGAQLGWLLAALGLAGLIAFIVHEARTAEPIIRPALFRSPRFAALNILTLAVNLASFATLLIVPYFLVGVGRLPVDRAGLVMTMNGIGMAAGSLIVGAGATGSAGGGTGALRPLSKRLPASMLAIAGATLAGAMLLVIGQWTPATPLLVLGASNLVQGFGVGLFQVAYNDSVIATLAVHDRGVAGSLTMMVRTLGIIGGATGLSALFKHLNAHAAAAGLDAEAAFQLAFAQSLAICGAGLLAVLAVTLLLARVWRWPDWRAS